MDNKTTTVVSKLLEYFEQQLRIQRTSNIKYSTEEALLDAVDVCKNAIKVERQQIEEAYQSGGTNALKYIRDYPIYVTKEEYYNQKYTQKNQN